MTAGANERNRRHELRVIRRASMRFRRGAPLDEGLSGSEETELVTRPSHDSVGCPGRPACRLRSGDSRTWSSWSPTRSSRAVPVEPERRHRDRYRPTPDRNTRSLDDPFPREDRCRWASAPPRTVPVTERSGQRGRIHRVVGPLLARQPAIWDGSAKASRAARSWGRANPALIVLSTSAV